jgi:rod shape-determining protein MreD
MKVVWSVLAIVVAVFAQAALGRLAPSRAAFLDPLLLVAVFCGLRGGQTHGMLAGMVCGWVRDVLFGGNFIGVSGLSFLIVGFAVGVVGTRFLLGRPAARATVVFLAVLADAAIVEGVALVFALSLRSVGLQALALRAGITAALGTALFELLDRRVFGEDRR